MDRRLNAKIEKMANVLNDPSLNIEPEIIDLDADGFDLEDYADFFSHVSEKVA